MENALKVSLFRETKLTDTAHLAVWECLWSSSVQLRIVVCMLCPV